MKNVFVSVLNFNGNKNTLECLRSLEKLNLPDISLSVVVTDNASKEKLELDENFLKNIPLKIFFNKENLGFSGGHNLGIEYALSRGADYVVILNNDVILDKNLIYGLVKSAQNPKIGIISPKIYFAKGFEYHKDRYKEEELGKVFWYAGGEMDWNNVIGRHIGVDEVDKGQYDKEREIDFASGCCMLIKKEVFGKTGMFDNRYFLYYEDNDLCQRTRKKGFGILYEPKAVLWHKNAGSAGGSGSALQDYYITRNRLLFGLSYAKLRTKFAIIRESLKILFSGRTWQKKGVLDFYLRKFGKGSYR